MDKGKCFRRVSVFCLTFMTLGNSVGAAQTPTALRCGVDQDRMAQRFFADPDGKNEWKEYRSVEAVPQLDLDDGGELARLWPGSDGNILFRTEEPGQDFAAYTDYLLL